jgi:FkbM family methyltransferase
MAGSIKRRLRRLRARFFPQPPPPTLEIGTFAGFQVAYRNGTADTQVIEESFDRDIFFAGVPEYRPGEEDVILDVGAHIGTFSLLASARAPRGRVFAVEASRESYNLCRINVRLNHIRNVEVSHLALSDRVGEVRLHHADGNWGHSTVAVRGVGGETVRGETLAAFMDTHDIVSCDFMKMNVEGAEFPILLATPPDVLRRFKVMLVLYHADLYRQAGEEDLLHHLRSAGFQCDVRQRRGRRGWIVAHATDTKPSSL